MAKKTFAYVGAGMFGIVLARDNLCCLDLIVLDVGVFLDTSTIFANIMQTVFSVFLFELFGRAATTVKEFPAPCQPAPHTGSSEAVRTKQSL